MNRILAVALLASAPLLGAQAHDNAPGMGGTIRQELAGARHEVRTELAKARHELEQGNLELGEGLQFGKNASRKHARTSDLPQAEISPKGDFLVGGKPVSVSAAQRTQLLDYRLQVIGMAKLGIDAGEQAAMAALDATNVSLFGLIVGGMTGSLERRIESTVKRHIEPMVLQICQRLPRAYASQQQLAVSLPEFRPYATLEQDDVSDCKRDLREQLAVR